MSIFREGLGNSHFPKSIPKYGSRTKAMRHARSASWPTTNARPRLPVVVAGHAAKIVRGRLKCAGTAADRSSMEACGLPWIAERGREAVMADFMCLSRPVLDSGHDQCNRQGDCTGRADGHDPRLVWNRGIARTSRALTDCTFPDQIHVGFRPGQRDPTGRTPWDEASASRLREFL